MTEAKDIVTYLLKNLNQKVQLYIWQDKLWFNDFPKKNSDDCSRSFYLEAKSKKRFWKRSGDIEYFISSSKDIKIFVQAKELLSKQKKIKIDDTIVVDNIEFSLNKNYVINQSPIIEIKNLCVEIKGKKLLNNINFQAYRGDFIAIMGPSGCGKSTLVKEIAGYNKKISGEIRISNKSLYNDFHTEIKSKIGYVEQLDHLHVDLTVEQVLFFTAKLRNISNFEDKIKAILCDLKLCDYKNSIIRTLSGGTQKRVAICIELLDQPDIILLDEPTSPLDPESINDFLSVIIKLAESLKKTVIMVTHKPTDLSYVHKVLFLSKGGYQVYMGSREYFTKTLYKQLNIAFTEAEADRILHIYKEFSIEETGKRFESVNNQEVDFINANPFLCLPKSKFLPQLCWLSIRYFNIKFPKREQTYINNLEGSPKIIDGWIKSLGAYLIQPILVGVLFFAFPFFNLTCLFLISLAVIWLGINNSSKEIVEEINIYKRERCYNLRVDAYLISKIIVLWLISIVQITLLVSIVWYRFHTGNTHDVNLNTPYKVGAFLSILSFASITLGLMLSTLDERVEKVLIWVPIVLMAQIVFSGVVSKPDRVYKENVSYLMLGRWGLEGLARLQDTTAPVKNVSLKITDSVFRNYKIVSRDRIVKFKMSKAIVIDTLGKIPNDTLINDTVSALRTLGSYNDKLKRDKLGSWKIFDSFEKNIVVILLHGIAAYFLCRLFLLKKDYISYNFFYTPNAILWIINIFLFVIISLILISPYFKNRGDYFQTLHELKNKKKDYDFFKEKKDLIDWHKGVKNR